jgi:polyhydroxyalkanoate synthase
MARVPFLYQRSQRVKKGATPYEVVYEEDRLKLLHYKSDSPPRFRTPLVFVFALVNRPYVLDLKDGKSVVQHFVERGFDTYLIDWGVPTDAERHLTLDDYINGYMPNVLDYLRERTGCADANVLGYCMGGTMSAMFTALHPQRVRNLILMAAGYRLRIERRTASVVDGRKCVRHRWVRRCVWQRAAVVSPNLLPDAQAGGEPR